MEQILLGMVTAVLAPVGWLGSLWQGRAHSPLGTQLPVGSLHGLAQAGPAMGALAALTLVIALAVRRTHLAIRVALVLEGLSIYLLIVASPLPYFMARLALSLTALALVCSARLVRRLRPIKTVLFFIGVGFTCEGLLWALANPFATVSGFAAFAVTAYLFARIDTKPKRALRTARFAFSGAIVAVLASTQWLDLPTSLTAVSCLATAALGLKAIHQLGALSVPEHAHPFETSPDGLTDLAFPHLEALGGLGCRIVYHAPELDVVKDPKSGLLMFRIASIFADTDSVLIGCGTPNFATSVFDDEAGTWKRMSAFMLYRERSHVAELDELQAGVYFELRGLGSEVRQRLLESMNEHSGMRVPSCAYLNARVLARAGFALGNGRSLTKVVLPSHFAKLIWQHGLRHEGTEVTMRVVNTSPLDVGDHFLGVLRKEATSPARMIKKMMPKKRASGMPALPAPAQVTGERTGSWSGRPVTIWMNRPTRLGLWLTMLWGRHSEFKVGVPGLEQVPELMMPLNSFAGPLSWSSKAKKHILFSKPVVAMINRVKTASFDRYDSVPVDAALEMMSPAAESNRVLWNFALVRSASTYQVRLSPLKNTDPLSENSKLRRFSNWVLAKHVVATGYDPNTVYAGEAWVVRSADGDLTLYINNNSGTYKPLPEQLQLVAKLFSGLGLKVTAVPHNQATPVQLSAHAALSQS